MNNLKPLPIGVEDFKEIVEKDYYYVDKTLFIKRDAYTLHRCKHPYNNHPYNNSTYFSVSSAFFSHLSTKASA